MISDAFPRPWMCPVFSVVDKKTVSPICDNARAVTLESWARAKEVPARWTATSVPPSEARITHASVSIPGAWAADAKPAPQSL